MITIHHLNCQLAGVNLFSYDPGSEVFLFINRVRYWLLIFFTAEPFLSNSQGLLQYSKLGVLGGENKY